MYQRIPVLARAVVGGLLVQITGVMPFMALVQLNLTTLPSVPWSAFVEWVLLFLFVKYFRGWGPPASTQASRQTYFRANRLAKDTKTSVAVATVLLGVSVLLLVVLGNQIVGLPADAIGIFTQLLDLSPLTAITILVTVAVMTGIVEESAFRGYMQVPLENRYGPVPAILIVAVAFSVVHFPPLSIFALYLLGAIGWGALARLSNSTVPGMIAHGLVDFTFFVWIFIDHETVERLLASSVLETGINLAFVVVAGLTVVCGLVTIALMRKIGRERSEHVDQ